MLGPQWDLGPALTVAAGAAGRAVGRVTSGLILCSRDRGTAASGDASRELSRALTSGIDCVPDPNVRNPTTVSCIRLRQT